MRRVGCSAVGGVPGFTPGGASPGPYEVHGQKWLCHCVLLGAQGLYDVDAGGAGGRQGRGDHRGGEQHDR